MQADETETIVKHIEHMVKIKEIFSDLEDDALTKSVPLPKSLWKTIHFFYR